MDTFIRRGIGFLGGTFDPVHGGHMAVATEALNVLKLQRVEFLPAANPWQKHVLTSADDRVKMIREAITGKKDIGINLTEILRGGITYTIDTLKSLREHYGPALPIVLIMGQDQWENLATWKDWEKYLTYASIAVCNRGEEKSAVPSEVLAWARPHEVVTHEIARHSAGSVTYFQIPSHKASSTKIREIFAQYPRDKALKLLETWLDPRVMQYICANHLYTH